jgi:hypothetical protein
LVTQNATPTASGSQSGPVASRMAKFQEQNRTNPTTAPLPLSSSLVFGLVGRINAWEAKQQHSNFAASSDSLDLPGIARCCLNRRGEPVRDLPAAYANLRIATRDRDQLVRNATAITHRIHSHVARLFPGFLTQGKSGIAPQNLPDWIEELDIESIRKEAGIRTSTEQEKECSQPPPRWAVGRFR